MANFNEEAAGTYDWENSGIYIIEQNDPVEGGMEGISNRQGRELALRTRNLHERIEKLKQDTTTRDDELDDAIDTQTEATLRNAKEYTDAREVVIQTVVDDKDATMLRTAKDYADTIVAALINGSPELMNTLSELADALGNDPNFATTVTNKIAKKLDAEDYTAADVLAKLLTVTGRGSELVADMTANQKSGAGLKFWKGTEAEYNAIETKDIHTIYIVL